MLHKHACIYTDVDELDLSKPEDIKDFLAAERVDYIVNCAAYTHVDKAESEADLAMILNRDIPANLLAAMEKHPATRLIHISTDYVYKDSELKEHKEDDPLGSDSVYGQTKLEGEKVLLNDSRTLILRTSWLYSEFGHNFVRTMLRLMEDDREIRVVNDQVGNPTYAVDLAMAIINIIIAVEDGKKTFVPGVYNFSNLGECSWYDLALEVCRMSSCRSTLVPIESHEYKTAAPRPRFSAMNKTKIYETYGLVIPDWKDSLAECLKNLF